MKKVEVQIERDAAGRLHAFVLARREDGHVSKGTDLLKKYVYRNIDTATAECKRAIVTLFRLIDPPEIEYVLPGQPAERGKGDI